MSTSGYRRGLQFDLGAGRASRETFMRAYGQSGTVFSIVSLLAQAAAAPTWHMYKKQPKDGRRRYSTGDMGDDQRVEVVQHAALSLWLKPNDFHSGFEFREGANQHEELTGETIWVVNREGMSFPTSMWYVRPDRLEPVPDGDDYLLGWIYNGPNGEQIPLENDEIIIEKLPDPLDPFRGAGPVASILPNIQQQKYATDYQRNLFLNGADPGGVITVDKRLSDSEWDEFVARWRESHQGVARAGRVGILENGASWTNAGQTNKDLEYGNLRLANRDELREAWRIHKAMLGTVEDVNRANAQTAEETFVAWETIPRLERRKDTLNSKLLPMFGTSGDNVEFDYEDPSPVNQEAANNELLTKAQAAQALVNAGYDPQAVLEAVGLPDMPIAEKATQQPALPPGWVAQPGPGAGSEPDSGDAGQAVPQARLRLSEIITINAGQPQPQQWPGWKLDQPAAAYWAPLITQAMSGAMSVTQARQLASAYQASHDPAPAGQQREAAREAETWLASQGVSLTPAIAALMPALIADGYLIGATSAVAAVNGAQAADTGAWQPGDTAAAQQQIGQLGLSADLNAQISGAGQAAAILAAGYVASLAAALVAGTGLGVTALAAGLQGVLSDKAHAAATALDHLLGTAGPAARSVYSARGITMARWQSEDDEKVCPVCMANEAFGLLPLGAAYPSGDTEAPAHNRCRCALMPASGESQAALLRRVLSDGYVPVQTVGRS